MTVHVITAHSCEASEVIGVFGTMAEAHEVRSQLIEEDPQFGYTIKPHKMGVVDMSVMD